MRVGRPATPDQPIAPLKFTSRSGSARRARIRSFLPMLSGATLRTFGESSRFGLRFVAFALLAALSPPEVRAHDPDVYGGLFRTQDAGANWIPVNPGIYASGALAVAVSPRDPNHLLLATESGVWRSRNAGRDWEIEAPDILAGTALAVAFDADGERALVAGVATLFRYDGGRWRSISLPSVAAPARALVAAPLAGRVYLAGRSGLYRSDDWGRTWTAVGASLEADARRSSIGDLASGRGLRRGRRRRVVEHRRRPQLATVGRRRRRRHRGDRSRSDLVPLVSGRLPTVGSCAAAARASSWRTVGSELPERPTKARALAILGDVVVIATDRGVFRSSNAGAQWEPPREGLPAHLPAGCTGLGPAPSGHVLCRIRADLLRGAAAARCKSRRHWRVVGAGLRLHPARAHRVWAHWV